MTENSATRTEANREIIRQAFDAWRQGTDGRGLETLEPFVSRSPELGAIFTNGLPVEALDPRDVSNAVLWLASEEARYVTGAALTVDAGNTIR
jgi:NAD(P)-dependent dehydrogenase (short-subunit alcohol dehydrogenase family)